MYVIENISEQYSVLIINKVVQNDEIALSKLNL